jgi:hypothetical protein
MKKKNKEIKIRNKNGDIVEIKSSKLKHQPIIHSVLGNELLERIKKIHNILKDVIGTLYDSQSILEQFEILFMRDVDPEKDVEIWENIVKTYGEAQKYFGNTLEVRKNIFRIIMFHVIGILKPEDKKRDDIQLICKIFNDIMALN